MSEYIGIGPEHGRVIAKEHALAYAMERCGIRFAPEASGAPEHEEFMDMLEEWFFSGNWVKE